MPESDAPLGGEETLRALRAALQLSPENLPLRQHLADTLLRLGHPEEAEQEYRRALAQAPRDQQLKLGLASAFYQQGKDAAALVVVEDLLGGSGDPPPRAHLLHARLLLRAGDLQRAGFAYQRALEFDTSLADEDLAERLRTGGGPSRPALSAAAPFRSAATGRDGHARVGRRSAARFGARIRTTPATPSVKP
ncbi:MAG: tetratricopeptide repeat protein [Chloroflexota bacterium]|nr:tetratricopeptide repeat protein [Chloroflexota bacterium]